MDYLKLFIDRVSWFSKNSSDEGHAGVLSLSSWFDSSLSRITYTDYADFIICQYILFLIIKFIKLFKNL